MRFLIISSGVNCQSYAAACLHSVMNQSYQNFKAVFIDDGSTDKTPQLLARRSHDPRFVIELFKDNQGAAYRRWYAIKKHSESPEDVILLLGMDDALELNALSLIKDQYDIGKWMTYGNWRDQYGKMLPRDFPIHFPDEIHDTRDYRKVRYRSTAPNTCKRFLFDQMTEDDFKVDGEWIRATTESNLMLSCLEMCGKERIGVIGRPIYRYNKRGKRSTKSVRGRTYQDNIYNTIINRPKKELYESKQDCLAGACQ